MLHNSSKSLFDTSLPEWLISTSLFLVYLYACGRILFPDIASYAGTLFSLTGLIFLILRSERLRLSTAVVFLFLAVLLQLVSWLLNFFDNPEWVSDNPRVDRLAKIFIFVSIAWWLSGDQRKVLWCWALALFGVLVGIWFESDGIGEWLLGVSGTRVDLGVRNWQHSAMFFGVCIIGLTCFYSRFCISGKFLFIRFLIWLLLVCYSMLGVYVTQTRAVFIGLIIVFLFLLVSLTFFSENQKLRRIPLALKFYLILLFLVFILVVFYFSAGARISIEFNYVWPKILSLELPLPDTSIGVRVNTWMAALSWILDKPFFGWGGEARGLVIDHTEWLSVWTKENIGHLHNYFIEISVSYGLVGLFLISSLYAWFVYIIFKLWRNGVISNDFAFFGFAFTIFWMFVNQFESYLSFWTGVYVHNIVYGGFVSIYWSYNLNEGRASAS